MRDPPPGYYRILRRVTKAAERETALLMKSLPKEFRDRISDVTIRFEDKPSAKMVEQGLSDEAFSMTNRDTKEIVVFLMNLFERFGSTPGAFNQEFRKALSIEFADWAGLDLELMD